MLRDKYTNPNLPSARAQKLSLSLKADLSQDSQAPTDRSQTQSPSESSSFLGPSSEELEKSWGYLEPWKRGLPWIYFYKTKERYVIGRKGHTKNNIDRKSVV